ncbi:MAG TPA: EF-P lysine aminoacylase EpmA, partial [Polyangiaceae bacterium]
IAITIPPYTPDAPTFFPSDPFPAGERFSLAGRVANVEPSAIWIADAFATVRVAGHADLEVGDLVVLRVSRPRDTTELHAVTERHRSNVVPGREHARLFVQGVGQKLRARAQALEDVRSFFSARDFLEVDTPLLVRSPGLDLHLAAVSTTDGFLITSPEYQLKRLLSGGIPRLYQLSHVFRRGEAGPAHNPEFTMLEWYRAFAGVADVMRDTEELVVSVVESIVGRPEIRTERGPIFLEPPFLRLSVAEAFERHAGIDGDRALALAHDDPDSYFRLLVDQVEPALALIDRPLFLVDYPISQASLARAKPGDPRVCERFELYLGGLELCNGFGELTDPVEQRQRLERDQKARAALGLEVYPIDERFLEALEEGMPPSAGNALGFDRLLMLCLGEREIGRVQPLPSGIL